MKITFYNISKIDNQLIFKITKLVKAKSNIWNRRQGVKYTFYI